MSLRGLLIKSGAVKPPSGITSWSGWPDDVRETLWRWNHTGRLSFLYLNERYPECADCGERFARQATVAVLYRIAERNGASKYGRTVCDPCLIKRAEASARQATTAVPVVQQEASACPDSTTPASPTPRSPGRPSS